MKKYLSLFVLFSVLFTTSTAQALERERPTYEDTDISVETQLEMTKKREALKAEMEANLKLKREAMKEKVQETKEEIKTEMKDVKDQAMDKMGDLKTKIEEMKDKKKKGAAEKVMATRTKAFEGFTKVLENILKTENKVKERIAQTKALGIDVTVAESNMVTVDAKLAHAKDNILKAATLLSSKTEKLTEAEKKELKELATAIQQDFKESRMLLNDTVKSLKDSIKEYRASLKATTEVKTSN